MIAEKVLFLVLDGISDRPCEGLDGQTPLAAAETPVLDRLAAEGICGIMDTIAPGIRPGSDTSHLALLGYPPQDYYTGRGPLEAEGTDPHDRWDDRFRVQFATMDEDGLVTIAGLGGYLGPTRSAAIREGRPRRSVSVQA